MRILNNYLEKAKKTPLKDEFKIIWKFFYNNAFAYVLLYAQNVLINKYMPVESLGQFSYGQSMLILFASVYSMEVYSAYLRFMGYSNEKELIHLTRRVLLIASALFSVTVVLYFEDPLYILFVGYMWMRERLYFFRSKIDISTYGRIKIFQYICSIMLLILLIASDNLNERSMLVAIGISYLIVSIFYNFNKDKIRIEVIEDLPIADTKEIIKYALPLSFNAIVVWLLGAADQMLIDTYLDAVTLTYYSVAFRNISVIRIGVSVIMEYWPRFYFERMEKKDYVSIKSMRKVFIALVAVLCIGSILFSEQLYWIMGASQYSHTKWMFCMLVMAELFRQCGSIYITFQTFLKNTAINIICLSSLGMAKVLINGLLIKTMGVSVLLYTMVGCYVLYFICGLYFGIWRERNYIN